MTGIRRFVADATEEIASEIFEKIKARTPVDTGRARDGWGMMKDGSATIIGNPVPYTPLLERGSSRQAPLGMVEITLAEMRAKNQGAK